MRIMQNETVKIRNVDEFKNVVKALNATKISPKNECQERELQSIVSKFENLPYKLNR